MLGEAYRTKAGRLARKVVTVCQTPGCPVRFPEPDSKLCGYCRAKAGLPPVARPATPEQVRRLNFQPRRVERACVVEEKATVDRDQP